MSNRPCNYATVKQCSKTIFNFLRKNPYTASRERVDRWLAKKPTGECVHATPKALFCRNNCLEEWTGANLRIGARRNILLKQTIVDVPGRACAAGRALAPQGVQQHLLLLSRPSAGLPRLCWLRVRVQVPIRFVARARWRLHGDSTALKTANRPDELKSKELLYWLQVTDRHPVVLVTSSLLPMATF